MLRPTLSALRSLTVMCIALGTTLSPVSAFGESLAANITSPAKNVILIIGDGMDDHQITIARNYLKGATGRLTLDDMPVRSSVAVLTVSEQAPDEYIYVADSACSGTSMSTGQATSRSRIATTAKSDLDIETIVEMAHKSGLKTGLVSTSSVTDATPAVFASHIQYRFCESPEKMVTERFSCPQDLKANGGPGSISEQLALSNVDVIFGGGMENFTPNVEGGTTSVLDSAIANGFTVLQTKQDLNTVTTTGKVLGLFADKHLATKLRGENGRIAEKPEPSLLNSVHWTMGDVDLPEPMICEANPAAVDTPSLLSMSSKAIDLLSTDNDKGFFLMIESASIDKQSHARNPCGSIGELDQLDETVAYALTFAEQNPGTLILVTADHSQAAQLVPESSMFSGLNIPVYSPGSMARIITPEGGLMGVNYATNDIFAEEHTGAAVPLYANDAAIGKIDTYINQTDIFNIAKQHLGL
jgi:alkaline phosphatase